MLVSITLLGGKGFKNIGVVPTSTYKEVGPYNHIFVLYCEVGGNGDGYILGGNTPTKSDGLNFIEIKVENSKIYIKATTEVSGDWYVKDLCKH